MRKRNFQVTPYNEVWVLTRDGRPQPVSWFTSEEEAIETVRMLAWQFRSEIVVHDPKRPFAERHVLNG